MRAFLWLLILAMGTRDSRETIKAMVGEEEAAALMAVPPRAPSLINHNTSAIFILMRDVPKAINVGIGTIP